MKKIILITLLTFLSFNVQANEFINLVCKNVPSQGYEIINLEVGNNYVKIDGIEYSYADNTYYFNKDDNYYYMRYERQEFGSDWLYKLNRYNLNLVIQDNNDNYKLYRYTCKKEKRKI